MRCRHLCADTCRAMRNDRVEKADDINAFLEHARSELLRFRCVTDHDRDDWMHSGLDRQTALGQGSAKVFGVLLQFVNPSMRTHQLFYECKIEKLVRRPFKSEIKPRRVRGLGAKMAGPQLFTRSNRT